jgi:hypothetical protein
LIHVSGIGADVGSTSPYIHPPMSRTLPTRWPG